ncbi:hypothetical protein ACSD7O_23900 [Methylorubrum extorquens]|uniref:hypothetical protein n=1 Tax=Methylorubrum extorquens TaxID=408 RepID=UPI003F5DBE62
MPLHAVREYLAKGRLVRLDIQNLQACAFALSVSAVYRTAELPGPAGRWVIERLKDRVDDTVGSEQSEPNVDA